MSTVNIQPVKFIKAGTELEVRFLDEDDKLKWYKGVVQRVNHFGEDDYGSYVSCSVLYEDGEKVSDACFYNKDFDEDNSLDSWRFAGNISLLISFMIKNTGEIQSLKDDLRLREENIRKLIEETLFDMDDPDYECDDECECDEDEDLSDDDQTDDVEEEYNEDADDENDDEEMENEDVEEEGMDESEPEQSQSITIIMQSPKQSCPRLTLFWGIVQASVIGIAICSAFYLGKVGLR
jgi:hypothetical protein